MNYPAFPLSKGLTILWSILQTVRHRAIFESSFIALFPNSYSFPCIRDCQGARTDGREKGLCMNELLPFPMPGAAHWASSPRKGHRGHAEAITGDFAPTSLGGPTHGGPARVLWASWSEVSLHWEWGNRQR